MPHVPDDRTAGSSTNNTQWYDLEKTANLPSPITQLNRDEAEKLVNIWRTSFASSCSSVAIPSTVTFDELCRDSPFLAGTMATAALYTDLKRQIEMARCCLKYFTETLFIQGKKSLDLLQGLLVFFSWYVITFCRISIQFVFIDILLQVSLSCHEQSTTNEFGCPFKCVMY